MLQNDTILLFLLTNKFILFIVGLYLYCNGRSFIFNTLCLSNSLLVRVLNNNKTIKINKVKKYISVDCNLN